MIQVAAGGEVLWGFGIGCHGSVGQSELGAVVLLKAVWWDLRFASLLMHLLPPLWLTECLQNDLFCVEWALKPYTVASTITLVV